MRGLSTPECTDPLLRQDISAPPAGAAPRVITRGKHKYRLYIFCTTRQRIAALGLFGSPARSKKIQNRPPIWPALLAVIFFSNYCGVIAITARERHLLGVCSRGAPVASRTHSHARDWTYLLLCTLEAPGALAAGESLVCLLLLHLYAAMGFLVKSTRHWCIFADAQLHRETVDRLMQYAAPRFAPLFVNLPAHARMHARLCSADLQTCGAFVHTCYERRTLAT
jgi:hypothetical protein